MGLPPLDAIVLDYARKNPGCGSADIASALEGAGNYTYTEIHEAVTAALERLWAQGRIAAEGTGRRWFGISIA